MEGCGGEFAEWGEDALVGAFEPSDDIPREELVWGVGGVEVGIQEGKGGDVEVADGTRQWDVGEA